MGPCDIQQRIKAVVLPKRSAEFDYHGEFTESGVRKAKDVLRQFELRLHRSVALERCAYVSIGASEGTEIEYILTHSPIKYGVVIDIDPRACAAARKRAHNLAAQGKHLEVIHGDVTNHIGYIKEHLLSLRHQGAIDGVVCSIYAVLHELFSRCQNFKENAFFGQLFWDWEPCVFVGREPCSPSNWPALVEISAAGLSSEDLAALAGEVRARLRFESEIVIVDPEFVCLASDLAVESLFKLFYLDNYAHEIEERLTTLRANQFVGMIERHLGSNSVVETRHNSDGFIERYRAHGVVARTADGQPLPQPLCFTSIFAQRVPAPRHGVAHAKTRIGASSDIALSRNGGTNGEGGRNGHENHARNGTAHIGSLPHSAQEAALSPKATL